MIKKKKKKDTKMSIWLKVWGEKLQNRQQIKKRGLRGEIQRAELYNQSSR